MVKKILIFIVSILVFGFLLCATKQYAELPVVKFSVSQQKIVAVENFKGEALPLSPLPGKYEKIYVK